MSISTTTVQQWLSGWQDPWLKSSWVDSGCLSAVQVVGAEIRLEVELPYPCAQVVSGLVQQVHDVLEAQGYSSTIQVRSRLPQTALRPGQTPIAGVRSVIAVASGKGGVGKSTTAVNLAVALSREGARVGILDADIYGPSVPLLMGLASGTAPEMLVDKRIKPLFRHGVQLMSLGFLATEATPVIWRGPMATSALLQMLTLTAWDDLDFLIVDMPPGTGDIALTIAQKVPVSAALIVTTPQDLSRIDAVKALEMFNKVNIPILGIVENMAIHTCSNCGHQEAVFGEGAGDWMAQHYLVEVLARLPLDIRLRRAADQGENWMQRDAYSDLQRLYQSLAIRSVITLGAVNALSSNKIATVDISGT